jgi:hypothetical protein
VEHFLFTLREGYSEYFGSAMTVLLRSVGVPARLATGYTTGDKVEGEDLYLVTDSHSHAWVEVYFPDYGWISFEPTKGRTLPEALLSDLGQPSDDAGDTAEKDAVDDFCFEEGLETCVDAAELSVADGAQTSSNTWSRTLLTILPWLLSAFGVAALLGSAAAFLWKRYMTLSEDPRAIYRRLALLGGLASVGPLDHQTPFQYRERLRNALPRYQEDVSVLVDAYVRSRYGAKELSFADRRRATDAWLRVRLPLLLRLFRRRTI